MKTQVLTRLRCEGSESARYCEWVRRVGGLTAVAQLVAVLAAGTVGIFASAHVPTIDAKVATIRLPAPAGLSYVLDARTIRLTWRAVSGAVSYVVEAGSAPGQANLAVWNTTALGLTAVRRPGTYYVRVRAMAEEGGSSDPSDEVLIRGGTRATAPTTTDIQSPSPRVGAAMAHDASRNVLVLFGGNGGVFLADTWERQGTTWTQRTPDVSPPARAGAAIAYDSARGVTVLFGGQIDGAGTGDASFLADTWEWDGVNWSQRTPAVSPGARYFAAVAYDATRRATVLFGGSDRGRTAFDETWEWDGTNWTKYPPFISPSARADAPLAYDSVRGVSVLFSGDRGSFPDDTWERRGPDWRQSTPAASPPGRGGSSMAFDSARAVTVLFGGHNGPPMGPRLADTWEWDGTTWTHRIPLTSPPARLGFAMAYDSARAVTVVFGGAGDAGPLGDTWEWDGSAWTQPQAPSPARQGWAR